MEEKEKLCRYKIKIDHLCEHTTKIQHCLIMSHIIDYASVKTKGIMSNTTVCKTIKCTQSDLKALLSCITQIGYTTSIAKINKLWF